MQTPLETKSRSIHYAWWVLVVSTLVVFGCLGLARFGYSLILPSMQSGLGLDNTEAGGIATADLLGYLGLALIGGVLASHLGPRTVIAGGLAVIAVGMLLTSWANSFAGAAFSRAISGMGSGASNVPVMALLAAWFAPRRRGLAAGVAVTGSSLGLMILGPLVPHLLVTYGEDGWRVCWKLFAAATAVLALLSWVVIRNKPADIGLHPLGEVETNSKPVQKVGGLEWGRVYRSWTVWHVGLVYVAFGFSYIIYVTFFSKYLIAEGGYTVEGAGQLFMLVGWMSLICGLLWGWVSDVIGRGKALAIVYSIHTIAYALFALWPQPAGFTISAVLFGISAWSIPAIMAATCGDLLGARLAPAGLGFITLFFGIGQAAGPSVAGWLADRTDSLAPALLLAAGVALLGVIGSSTIHPAGLKNQSP